MTRFIIVFLQLFSILFIGGILGSDVEIKLNAPSQINAGNEIRVEITLNKGSLNGFSRFQMELPNGITATNEHSANADFSFTDQKVRLIWLRMPDDENVTFAFNIKCNERLKGNFDLSGKFSYIDDNERKTIELGNQNIAIIPNPGIDPGLIVDIRDFGKSVYQGVNTPGEVACIRQKPELKESGEYLISILVNKDKIKSFAKVEENVPAGYSAINVDSKGGVFNFRSGKVKFLWMNNLPVDPYFVVSYKLIPVNGQQNPSILGSFSYMEDDKTKSVPIVEKDVSLAMLSPDIVRNIIASQAIIASATKPIDTNIQNVNNTQQTNIVTQNTTNQNNVTNQNTVQNNNQNNNTTNVVSNNQVKTQDSNSVENVNLLKPQSGISFRVQIAAGHQPINIKRYFNKYKLDNSVIKENHEGWIKYSIGNFSVYRDARDYRTHIWNTTTLTDAFVSAYNEGKRITVQEALMVANQKWYK